MSQPHSPARRRFIGASINASAAAATGSLLTRGLGGILLAQQAPAVIAAESARPQARWGLQIGDCARATFARTRSPRM